MPATRTGTRHEPPKPAPRTSTVFKWLQLPVPAVADRLGAPGLCLHLVIDPSRVSPRLIAGDLAETDSFHLVADQKAVARFEKHVDRRVSGAHPLLVGVVDVLADGDQHHPGRRLPRAPELERLQLIGVVVPGRERGGVPAVMLAARPDCGERLRMCQPPD